MGLKKWEEDNLGGRWRWKPCTWDWSHTEWTRHGYRHDGSPGWDVAVRVVGVCPGGGATAGPEQGVELEVVEGAIHISSDSSPGYLTNSHWFFLQLEKMSLGLESDQDELKSQDQPKSRRISALQSRMKTEATFPGVAVSCREDRQEEMVDEDETTSATSSQDQGVPKPSCCGCKDREAVSTTHSGKPVCSHWFLCFLCPWGLGDQLLHRPLLDQKSVTW